ncbi:MAG TPA: spore germination protein GerW family protein [Anaerolineales bacterium]|nr:spore germination protein GerW family protein [Anaerolineales bacterium]
MTEEFNVNLAGSEFEDARQALDATQDVIELFLETASVDRVYGDPIQHGDTLIIPTAEVLAGLGFGMGYGFGDDAGAPEEERKGGRGGGGGGGGGGRVLSRPVAVIVASPDGVRVEPVVDPTKIALAALTAAGFMLGMFIKMSNLRNARQAIQEG